MGHDGGLYRACSQKCPPRTFGCLLMLGGDLLTRVLGRWDSVGGWYRNPFPHFTQGKCRIEASEIA